MKKIKVLAIITTAVCGFYFTSTAQTTTPVKQDKQTQSQSTMQSTDMQHSDEISLNSSPTIEKSSQGYKLQVWVLPEEETGMNSEFDSRYDNKELKNNNDARIGNTGTSGTDMKSTKSTEFDKSTKTGTDYKINSDINKDENYKGTTGTIKSDNTGVSGNVSGTGTGVSGSVGTGTGVSGSVGTGTGTSSGTVTSPSTGVGTTNPSGTTGSSGTTSTIGSAGTKTDNSMNTQNPSGTFNKQGSTADNQNTGITRDDWRAQANQTGQATAMNDEKSTVVVKVIDEKTGQEVDAKNIEMKVITPSKKSFTTDLREKQDLNTGELALTEDGIYNIQTTIRTEDNKSIVIPFTYDNNLNDQSSMRESKDDIDDTK